MLSFAGWLTCVPPWVLESKATQVRIGYHYLVILKQYSYEFISCFCQQTLRLFSPDRFFGLFPQGFQFVDAASLQRSTQRGFNTGETVEEALIRAGEAFFGFDLAPTGHVHQGEQQIAQFLLGMGLVAAGHRLLEFVQLLMDLLPDAGHVIPLEAGFGRFLGDGHGSSQGRQAPHLGSEPVAEGAGGARQGLGLLLELDGLPAASHLVTGAGDGIAEHMGVTADQFVADAIRYRIEIKPLLFPSDLRMQHNLQQQVTQFFF